MPDRPDPAPEASEPRDWPRLGHRFETPLLLFRPRWDRLVNPRTGAEMERLVLETPEWVNVVARTVEGRFVVVRQYRFGAGRATTEIPGGLVDPGEEPRAAAERELLEETGYRAARWTSLGWVEPNPAIHDNRCHQFLAEGCERVTEQALDPGEDIVVREVEEGELVAAIRSGEIAHSLVVAALCRVVDLRGVDNTRARVPGVTRPDA